MRPQVAPSPLPRRDSMAASRAVGVEVLWMGRPVETCIVRAPALSSVVEIEVTATRTP